MNRRLFTILTALMWLALPLTALRYAQSWNALPAAVATHFAANGQPNGWMSRTTALYYALGVTAFVLIIFTAIALVILRQKRALDNSSIAVLGFFYVILAGLFYVNNGIIEFNITGAPVPIAPVLLGVPLAIVLFTVIYLRSQRGPALPETPTLAEESHGSRAFAVLFLVIALIELAAAYAIPLRGARTGMALSSAFFLLIAAHTWSGFHYRFTSAGLEISTLGYRLRSIPQAQIADYRPEKWMALRGYGIRGVGKTRAYVWGNDVVHITMRDGEVFLGTNDPARIVRDLDMMKHSAHT
jgi:Domain of unknown function (DUF1648)